VQFLLGTNIALCYTIFGGKGGLPQKEANARDVSNRRGEYKAVYF
jgi:hypothetical protein